MNNKLLYGIALLVIIVVVIVALVITKQENKTSVDRLLQDVSIIVYKSPTCGCCGDYVEYLKQQGARLTVNETEKMTEIKSQYHVPPLLESCHTSVVGEYVVEGHVPVEAIRKLLDEHPAIAGISLPEMPAGSPGMGGTQLVPFEIHNITLEGADGGIFMKI